MSNPVDHANTVVHGSPADEQNHEPDVVESIAHSAPVILPIVGAVLMFLLAFIAVSMA
jgi:hypothetical protein